MGFFTRQNRFQRFLEERRGHTFDDDESYAPRIINDYQLEPSSEPQLTSFVRPSSCDPSIRETGMSNGKVSPFANGYNNQGDIMLEERTNVVQLTTRTDNNYRTPSPQAIMMMEYTDSDIITTTSSQKSLEKPPNYYTAHLDSDIITTSLEKPPNSTTMPQASSPTLSLCSKETDL